MVKIFCTDVEMENDHVPEFLLWLFKNLYGFRGPRPLFENDTSIIDFFLSDILKNMMMHELHGNPSFCGGSKIIDNLIEKLRNERREQTASGTPASSSNGKSKQKKNVSFSESGSGSGTSESVSGSDTTLGDAFKQVSDQLSAEIVTPETQISSSEIKFMKRMMRKLNQLPDDSDDDVDDSPINRRKSGKLKRRRKSN